MFLRFDLKYYGEQEIQKTYNVNGLFSKKMAREWEKVPGCQERQERLFEFYQELGGEVTEELEKLADRVENSRLIEGLFENF